MTQMSAVLRLSKTLRSRAEWRHGCVCAEHASFHVRHYSGPSDILPWLQVQQEALADQRGGRFRTEADFRRMWLAQVWWQPDRLMFACPRRSTVEDRKSRRVVGTVGFRPVTLEIARLFWLAVRPEWQRQGVGRLLVEAVERQCAALGVHRLELETLPDWAGAIAFYRSLGFSTD